MSATSKIFILITRTEKFIKIFIVYVFKFPKLLRTLLPHTRIFRAVKPCSNIIIAKFWLQTTVAIFNRTM